MTKQEARQIADKFKKDLPHLADRGCRIRVSPAGGYNAHTEWYLIPRGPRGGLQPRQYITFATNGAVFMRCDTGDIIMEVDVVNRWTSHGCFVVLPFHENHEYERPDTGMQFTPQEQLEAALWYKEHCEPEELHWLLDVIDILHEDVEWQERLSQEQEV